MAADFFNPKIDGAFVKRRLVELVIGAVLVGGVIAWIEWDTSSQTRVKPVANVRNAPQLVSSDSSQAPPSRSPSNDHKDGANASDASEPNKEIDEELNLPLAQTAQRDDDFSDDSFFDDDEQPSEEFEFRTWTSNDGTYTKVAKFVSFDEDADEVTLEDERGKQIAVPLSKLSVEDTNYLTNLSIGRESDAEFPDRWEQRRREREIRRDRMRSRVEDIRAERRSRRIRP